MARTRDLAESLEQQTATSNCCGSSAALRAQLEPVFQTMLGDATRIYAAPISAVNLYDGDCLHPRCVLHVPPALCRIHDPRANPPHPEGGLGQVVRTKKLAHFFPIFGRAAVTWKANPAVVALRRHRGRAHAAHRPMPRTASLSAPIAIYRQEVRLFTDKQIELLSQHFAPRPSSPSKHAAAKGNLRQRNPTILK